MHQHQADPGRRAGSTRRSNDSLLVQLLQRRHTRGQEDVGRGTRGHLLGELAGRTDVDRDRHAGLGREHRYQLVQHRRQVRSREDHEAAADRGRWARHGAGRRRPARPIARRPRTAGQADGRHQEEQRQADCRDHEPTCPPTRRDAPARRRPYVAPHREPAAGTSRPSPRLLRRSATVVSPRRNSTSTGAPDPPPPACRPAGRGWRTGPG